jgi:hypothetical protein
LARRKKKKKENKNKKKRKERKKKNKVMMITVMMMMMTQQYCLKLKHFYLVSCLRITYKKTSSFVIVDAEIRSRITVM